MGSEPSAARASAEKGLGVFFVAVWVGLRPRLGCGRSCGEVGLTGYREAGAAQGWTGPLAGLPIPGGGEAVVGHLFSRAERGVLEWVVS